MKIPWKLGLRSRTCSLLVRERGRVESCDFSDILRTKKKKKKRDADEGTSVYSCFTEDTTFLLEPVRSVDRASACECAVTMET